MMYIVMGWQEKIRFRCLVVFMLFAYILIGGSIANAKSCDEKSVVIRHQCIYSNLLKNNVNFAIYLPACYDERLSRGYPVIYLLHGQEMGLSFWKDIGLAEAMRAGQTKTLPQFIIVTPQEDQYLKSLYDSNFDDIMIQEIIPFVDQNFNTAPNRDHRAIGGISRGASWAGLLAFEHPDMFCEAGLHSIPGTLYDDQSMHVLIQRQTEEQRLRIRFDTGNLDSYRHEGQKFSQQLNFLGYPHAWHINHGGHDSAYWKSQIDDYLFWYSSIWRDKGSSFK